MFVFRHEIARESSSQQRLLKLLSVASGSASISAIGPLTEIFWLLLAMVAPDLRPLTMRGVGILF